jgi:hypothetical protein
MNTRKIMAIICQLALAIAIVCGMVHHHGHGPDQCAACQWQVTGTAVLPVVIIPPAPSPVVLDLAPPRATLPTSFFSLATASRAPPSASA